MKLKIKPVYVHYGHSKFYRDNFDKVRNHEFLVKPSGGLWASDKNSNYGWVDFCKSNNFREGYLTDNFKFTIKDGARKLRLAEPRDFLNLPTVSDNSDIPHYGEWIYLDFEKLAKTYDYIEFEENGYTHYVLYGWDCDCILVLNPDVVEPL